MTRVQAAKVAKVKVECLMGPSREVKKAECPAKAAREARAAREAQVARKPKAANHEETVSEH